MANKKKVITKADAYAMVKGLLAGPYPTYYELGRALGVSHVAVSKWIAKREVPPKYHAGIVILRFASDRRARDLITSYEVTGWGKVLGRLAIARAILTVAAQVYDGSTIFNRCSLCYASRYMSGLDSVGDRECSCELDPNLCYESGVYQPIEPALARTVIEQKGA